MLYISIKRKKEIEKYRKEYFKIKIKKNDISRFGYTASFNTKIRLF